MILSASLVLLLLYLSAPEFSFLLGRENPVPTFTFMFFNGCLYSASFGISLFLNFFLGIFYSYCRYRVSGFEIEINSFKISPWILGIFWIYYRWSHLMHILDLKRLFQAKLVTERIMNGEINDIPFTPSFTFLGRLFDIWIK